MPSLLDKHELPDILSTLDPSIPVVSPSQLSVYSRCAYNWNLHYIRGWGSAPRDQAETGSIFHDLAATYYKTLQLSDHETGTEATLARLKFLSEKFTTWDQLDQLHRAGRIMIRYMGQVALELDSGMKIVGVEKHFVVLLATPTGKPFYLQGYIDLLGRTKVYKVIDHKTAPHTNKFYTPDQVQMDLQLKCYALAATELGYPCSDVAINNINTYGYKNFESEPNEKLFKRTKAHYSGKELETFKYELGLLVDEMFYTESNPYRRSIDKSCGSCYMKEPCLQEQKGLDITRLLEQKYVRRARVETYKDLVLGVDNPVRVE